MPIGLCEPRRRPGVLQLDNCRERVPSPRRNAREGWRKKLRVRGEARALAGELHRATRAPPRRVHLCACPPCSMPVADSQPAYGSQCFSEWCWRAACAGCERFPARCSRSQSASGHRGRPFLASGLPAARACCVGACASVRCVRMRWRHARLALQMASMSHRRTGCGQDAAGWIKTDTQTITGAQERL